MKYFLFSLVLSEVCFAQGSDISGIIKDKTTGEAVLFAHVYLANTTRGTTSDANGRFSLEEVPAGQFTLVCTMVGYESYLQNISLMAGKSMELIIELNPSRQLLNEIELKGQEDKKWKRQFKLFERELMGDVQNASRCEIMNPWVVDFEIQKFDNLFSAHANQPLIIENRILGYKISFLLKRFEIERGQLIYIGYPSFEALDVDDWDYVENFLRHREDTFKGSTRHFFYALIQDKLEEEGFKVYRASRDYDQTWPNRLSEAVNSGYLRPMESSEIMVGLNSAGDFKIYTNDILEIIYTKRLWSNSPYQDAPYEVSRIKLNDQLIVSRHGYVFNPYSFVVYGFLSEERIANMLPFEYGSERLDH
jgi:hypothetical protein